MSWAGMQAIARANRTAEGKTNGLVVDYYGILKNLRKALATFAGGEDGEDELPEPARPEAELLGDLSEAIMLIRHFLDEGKAPLEAVITAEGFAVNAAIQACKEVANENDETRKRFEIMCRLVFQKFKACLNVPEVNQFRAARDAINAVYKSLQSDRYHADISDIMRSLHTVIGDAVEVRQNLTGED